MSQATVEKAASYKAYKAKEIEAEVQKNDGTVRINLPGKGETLLTMKQFATLVRGVISADRKRVARSR